MFTDFTTYRKNRGGRGEKGFSAKLGTRKANTLLNSTLLFKAPEHAKSDCIIGVSNC